MNRKPNNLYYQVNLFDLIGTEGLASAEKDIQNFKSKNNDDVEKFLKQNSVSFCSLKQSITYLLYDFDNELKAYFALAFKIVDLPIENMSNTLLKQLERYGQRKDNMIQVPGILLAQWSKNFNCKESIAGKDLLEYVEDAFRAVQRLVGGSFIFVECEAEKTGLVARYQEYGFKDVSERISGEGKPLVQFIKKI